MSEITREQLAKAIHDSGTRFVLAVTGGGSEAISALVTVPGASRSVLEAVVPYSAEALTAWLGSRPEQFCSARTARAMAMVGFQRAKKYAPESTVAGVACTASLASDRPKHGPHRLHAAMQTASTTASVSLELEKGKRTRAAEEHLAADVVLNLVAEACGLEARLILETTDAEPVIVERVVAPVAWQELLSGVRHLVRIGAAANSGEKPSLIFPGAFNPLHTAHRRMAAVAAAMCGSPAAFEMSIENVDKPPLDFIEIEERARQFAPDQTLWLTSAPTFVEKARLFPGATFVVGADTIARIADPRYYGGDASAVTAAIDAIAACGCRFLVFGRRVDEKFVSLADLNLPRSLARLCQAVPETEFREDISSTELRRQHAE